jgi:transcriptional regulator with XRE-family HTH domain
LELEAEMLRNNLTRKQLAERHGISSDRVTQWLCLLKLPEKEKVRLLALGDNWDNQVITERELRSIRKQGRKANPN